MNSSEKRKDYIRNIYSKQWSSKRKEYGIVEFDKELSLNTNNRKLAIKKESRKEFKKRKLNDY